MSYQDMIEIGGIMVPVIMDDEGEKWYPLSYLGEKVLLRRGGLKGKDLRERYDRYLRKLKVDFTAINEYAGVQVSNCISEVGLKEMLSNSYIGRLTLDQRKAQNRLLRMLGLPLISERQEIKDKLNEDEFNEHDDYVKDVITSMLQEQSCKFQLCVRCEKYFPQDSNFFNLDNRTPSGYTKICHKCIGNNKGFKHPDNTVKKVVKDIGEEYYAAIKEGHLLELYEKYMNRDLRFLPDCYHNKEDYLKIINWLYENKYITNLSTKELIGRFRLIYLSNYLTIHQIHTHLFGEDYYLSPWRYNMQFKNEIKLTYEIANKVFSNFLGEFNVNVSNPLVLDYENLIRKAKLTQVVDIGSTLYFAVQYNDFKYAGYQYKTKSINYYKDRENLKFDLKYFIENDLKIQPYKIPLYLKKWNLKRDCAPIANAILSYQHLYQVVNEIYPDMFDENDFKLGYTLGGFDSDIEYDIDQILRASFKNVIYNQRDRDDTISLDRCIPDWLILTENGVWIVEYLGMYLPNKKGKSSLVDTYLEKAEKKFVKYDNLKGYNVLYLLPEDVENNYSGVREKIKSIG